MQLIKFNSGNFGSMLKGSSVGEGEGVVRKNLIYRDWYGGLIIKKLVNYWLSFSVNISFIL